MKLFTLMEMSCFLLIIFAFVNSDVTSTRSLNLNGNGEGDHGLAVCDPQKNSCKNGGECIQQGESYKCFCFEGTSGDFCELVQDCKDPKFCGDRLRAKCYFNVTKKRADCVCYDERKTFDPAKKVCKRICGVNNHECESGGTCVKNGNSNYCKCLNGTKGDLCEIVNECERYPCGYSSHLVKCYFDVLEGKAACKCLDEDSAFYEEEKACRKVCSAKNRCKNGGLCVNIGNYSFCSCLDGTSGDLCQSVKDCGGYTCGNDRLSSCYFDVENRKAACRCDRKDYIYDNERRVCKRICGKDNSCANGGTCRKYGNYSLCTCPNGTSGDLCDIIDECQNSSLCGNGSGVQCYFNESKGKAACRCHIYETKVFDPYRKVCQRPCDAMMNGCQNGGICVKYGNYSFCSCREGTTGDFCEYVSGCLDPYVCGDIYNTDCYFNQSTGKAACKCRDKEKVFNVEKKICMKKISPCSSNPCKNGGSCNNETGKVVCKCIGTFSGIFCETDVCRPNPCKNGGTCSILNGIANCKCPKGYSGKTCETDECDCPNGFCERNDKGRLVCKCLPEWGLIPESRGGGGCKKCDCGEGANCTFDTSFWSNTKYCICKEGYRDVKGFCKDVCTPNPCKNGGKCSILNGIANCICPKGYAGKICETDPCSSNPCMNGGTCKIDGDSFKCLCKDSYLGKLCDKSPCFDHNCTNGGLCREVNNKPRCYCLSPFTGEFCEKDGNKSEKLSSSVPFTTPRYLSTAFDHNTSVAEKLFTTISKRIITTTARSTTEKNISFTNWGNDTATGTHTVTPDPCSYHFCMNGGYCREVNNRPRCYCLSPFAGEFCEKDPCTPSLCVNGGTCRIQNSRFRCDCNEPFTGDFCEKDPCTENPCQHGGTCILSGYTFKCICKEAFTGEKCESSCSDIRYVLTLVVLSLLIIIFSVLVTCLAFRSRCMSKE